MNLKKIRVLLIAGSVVALAGCMKQVAHKSQASADSNTTASSSSSSDPITSAESAAPASIAHQASIATVDASGAMKTLRQGSNGWTCMPDAPTTPGPDPMCFDANAGKWVRRGSRTSRRPETSASCTCSKAAPMPATPIPMRPSRPPTTIGSRPVRTSWSSGRRTSSPECLPRQARHRRALRDVGRDALRASDDPGELTAK